MDLGVFYVRLGAIVIIVALGFLLGRRGKISEHTNRDLANLLLTVFMPAALFSAFPDTYNDAALEVFASGLLAGVIVMLALIMVSKAIFNKKWLRGDMRYEAQFAMIFNNATFLGYPIVVNTFGSSGVIAYCGFIVAFNVALFSYGEWLFERKINKKLIKGVLLNPNIIGVLLGMLVFLAEIRLPEFIDSAVEFVGAATTPVSLICVGYMLSKANLRTLVKKWRVAVVALIQLVVGPLLTFVLLRLLHFSDEVVQVCTLIQALPTATSLGLFATKYGKDEVNASELVAMSTVLSVVTLPVMVTLLLG